MFGTTRRENFSFAEELRLSGRAFLAAVACLVFTCMLSGALEDRYLSAADDAQESRSASRQDKSDARQSSSDEKGAPNRERREEPDTQPGEEEEYNEDSDEKMEEDFPNEEEEIERERSRKKAARLDKDDEDKDAKKETSDDKPRDSEQPATEEPQVEEPKVERRIIGATATIMEKQSELLFKARVDSGAKSCSLHVEDMKIKDESEKMADNIDKVVSFLIKNGDGEEHWLEAKIAGYVIVKTSDNRERRYKVPLTFRWKDFEKTVLVTLNNREKMEFPLLLGRNFLRKDFLIDVDQENDD